MNYSPETQTQPITTKRIQGHAIPAIGLGTYELRGDTCRKAVSKALDVGYRHIDTARIYENEREVGSALRHSNVDREKLFITSKVWREKLAPEQVREEVEKSLIELQTDYLDLALIHWPSDKIPLEASLNAVQELQDEQKILHFGVSNFPPNLFRQALDCAEIFCNQIEYHPMLDQTSVLDIASDRDVAVTAYSPLAQGSAVEHDVVKGIAERHGREPNQVVLRWLFEQTNVIAIPRSSNPKHIESNIDIFDFNLHEADHAQLAGLLKNRRLVDPEFAPDWDN